MLSMKTLRVAIVAIGSALLLGPGFAAAQATSPTTNLDAISPAFTLIAAETLADSANTVTSHGSTGAKYFDVHGPDRMDISFRPRLQLDAGDGYHLRIELDGMIFRAAPAMFTAAGIPADNNATPPTPYIPPDSGLTGANNYAAAGSATFVRDGVGSSVAVIDMNTAITLLTHIKFELSEALAVDSLSPGSYGISVTLHRDQFDAIDGIGAIATASVGGSAALIRVVDALGATINNGSATASVDADFLWFVAGGDITNVVSLGNAEVDLLSYPGGMVYDARNGLAVALLDDDTASPPIAHGLVATPMDDGSGGVIVNIEGDTTIGAFALAEVDATGSVMCGLDATGHTPENPLTGIESLDPPATNTMGGLMPGTAYALCVNVDTEGPESNTVPIEEQEFAANVLIVPGDTDLVWGPAAKTALLGSGTIGTIKRDGTAQRVTYLTASEKYNQRLIIVNHSGKMVKYDLVGITTEDGTSVMLSDAAMAAKEAGLNTIMPKSQVVLRVGDILNFEGKNRAAATVTVNSNPANISIATTQVNLEDGSTDTVIYD